MPDQIPSVAINRGGTGSSTILSSSTKLPVVINDKSTSRTQNNNTNTKARVPPGGSRRTNNSTVPSSVGTRSDSRLDNPSNNNNSNYHNYSSNKSSTTSSVITSSPSIIPPSSSSSTVSPLGGMLPSSTSPVQPFSTQHNSPLSPIPSSFIPYASTMPVFQPKRPARLHLTAVATAPPTRDLDLGNAMTELYTLKKISSMFRTEVKLSICPGLDIRGLLNTMAGTEPGEPRPDILHFIGHGATLLANAMTGEVIASVPLLMTTTGPRYEKQADAYDASAIARTLSFLVRTGGGPRLIVLQACKTAEFAKRLARAMPHGIILAWQTQVLDEGCHSFSDAFYRHLFASLRRKGQVTAKDILIAFIAARFFLGDVFKCTDPEHESSRIGGKRAIGVPILISGGGIHRDDVIFEVSPLSREVFVAMGGEEEDYPWSVEANPPQVVPPTTVPAPHTTVNRRTNRNIVYHSRNQPISESDEGADEENSNCDSDNQPLPERLLHANIQATAKQLSSQPKVRTTSKPGTYSLSSYKTQSGSNPIMCSDSSISSQQGKVKNSNVSDCSYSISEHLRISPMNVPNYEGLTSISSSNMNNGTNIRTQVNGTMLGSEDDDDDNEFMHVTNEHDEKNSGTNCETMSMQRDDAGSCFHDNMSDTDGMFGDQPPNKEDTLNNRIYSNDDQNDEIYKTADIVSFGLDGEGLPRMVSVQSEQQEINNIAPLTNPLVLMKNNNNSNNQNFIKKDPSSINDNNDSSHHRKRPRTRAVSTATSTMTVTNAMGNNQRMLISIEPDNTTSGGLTCASSATLDGRRNINYDEIHQISKQVIVVDDDNIDMVNSNSNDESIPIVLPGRTVNPTGYDDVVSPYGTKVAESTIDDNSNFMDEEVIRNKVPSKKSTETTASKEANISMDTEPTTKVKPSVPWLMDSDIPKELGFFDSLHPHAQAAAKAYSRDVFMELPGGEDVTVYIGIDPFEDGRSDTLNLELLRFRAELEAVPGATPIKGMLSPMAHSTAGSISTTSTSNATATSVTTTTANTTTNSSNSMYTSTNTTTTTSSNMTSSTTSNTNKITSDSFNTLQNPQHSAVPNLAGTQLLPNRPIVNNNMNSNGVGNNNNNNNNNIGSMGNNTNKVPNSTNNNNNGLANTNPFGTLFGVNNNNMTNNNNTNNNRLQYPDFPYIYSAGNPQLLMNQFIPTPNQFPFNNYMNMGGYFGPNWNNTFNLTQNNANNTNHPNTMMNSNNNTNNLLPSLYGGNNNNNNNQGGFGYRSVDVPVGGGNGTISPYKSYQNLSPSQQQTPGLSPNPNDFFLAGSPTPGQQIIYPLSRPLNAQSSVSPVGGEFDRDIWDGKEILDPKEMQMLLECAKLSRYGHNNKQLSNIVMNSEERKEKENYDNNFDLPGGIDDDETNNHNNNRPSSQSKIRLPPLHVSNDDTTNNNSNSKGSTSTVINVPPSLGKRYISPQEKYVFDQDPLVQGLSISSPPNDPVLAARYERITDKALVLYRIIRKLRAELAYLRSNIATYANMNTMEAKVEYDSLTKAVSNKQKEITELAFHIHRYMSEKRAMDGGNPLNITFRIIEKKQQIYNPLPMVSNNHPIMNVV